MIVQTRGIVFSYIKFKDTSIIVKIYTEKYGLKSFLVNGIRSKKSKSTIGLFQPFTLLDLQIYFHEQKDLLRISDSKIDIPTPNISENIKKGTMALFLTEILSKALYHEHHENPDLYRFLQNRIIALEQLKEHIEDFHVVFLTSLAPLLGFGWSDIQSLEDAYLEDNVRHYLEEVLHVATYMEKLESLPQVNGNIRMKALDSVLKYYRDKMELRDSFKSLAVLHQIFH